MKYPVPLAEIIWHDAATTQGWELHGDVDTEEVIHLLLTSEPLKPLALF